MFDFFKIFRSLRIITSTQNYYDRKEEMKKALPHLATRNEDLAKEVLGFLCIMLFNANTSVQVSPHFYQKIKLPFPVYAV